MPTKPVELVMADGETTIYLRPLTKHPDDKELARLFYHVEHFANQVVTHVNDASKAIELDRVTKITELTTELRLVRDAKFAAFLVAYLKPMEEADVLSKVVAQCGENEMDFILDAVRSSPGYAERELNALVYGSPVPTFEMLASLLQKTPAGKAYLQEWLKSLSAVLTPPSAPSGTTPAAS